MVVSSPLSRGLDNITKVYLITCDQSTCSNLKKHEFCRNFNEKYPHLFSYLLYNYNVHCVHNNMDVYEYCILSGCFTPVLWSQYHRRCFTPALWSQYHRGCFTPALWSQYELGCFTPVLWSQYQPGCFTPSAMVTIRAWLFHPSAMVTIRA